MAQLSPAQASALRCGVWWRGYAQPFKPVILSGDSQDGGRAGLEGKQPEPTLAQPTVSPISLQNNPLKGILKRGFLNNAAPTSGM